MRRRLSPKKLLIIMKSQMTKLPPTTLLLQMIQLKALKNKNKNKNKNMHQMKKQRTMKKIVRIRFKIMKQGQQQFLERKMVILKSLTSRTNNYTFQPYQKKLNQKYSVGHFLMILTPVRSLIYQYQSLIASASILDGHNLGHIAEVKIIEEVSNVERETPADATSYCGLIYIDQTPLKQGTKPIYVERRWKNI